MEELSLSEYSLPRGMAPGAGEDSARWGGLLLTPAGSMSPAGNWARSRAAHGSSWEGLVLVRPPSIPSPSPTPLCSKVSGVDPCTDMLWVYFAVALPASVILSPPVSSFLPPNPSLVQAGHQFKKQLLFCNHSLARMLWELEHLLSGFSSIHFVSGLGNWHKSTLGLEQEEAGCYSGT